MRFSMRCGKHKGKMYIVTKKQSTESFPELIQQEWNRLAGIVKSRYKKTTNGYENIEWKWTRGIFKYICMTFSKKTINGFVNIKMEMDTWDSQVHFQ